MALDRVEVVNALSDPEEAIEEANASDDDGFPNTGSVDEDIVRYIEALFARQLANVQQSLVDMQQQAQALLMKRRDVVLQMEAELDDLRTENQVLRDRCASVGVTVESIRQSETGGTGEACEASSSSAPAVSSSPAVQQKRKKPMPNSSLKAMLRSQDPSSPAAVTPVSPPGLPPDLRPLGVRSSPKDPSPKHSTKPKSHSVPITMDMPGVIRHDDEEREGHTEIQDFGQPMATVDSMYDDEDGEEQRRLNSVMTEDVDKDANLDGKEKRTLSFAKNIEESKAIESLSKDEFSGVVPHSEHNRQSDVGMMSHMTTIQTLVGGYDDDDGPGSERQDRRAGRRQQMSVYSGGPLLPMKMMDAILGETDDDGRRKPQAIFADAAAMKDRVRQAVVREPYNVHDKYHKKGLWQFIAKHPIFENFTLFVIACNAAWISIDTDYNKADTVQNSDAIFQIAENLFCAYFSFEWFTRFMAFKWKRDGLQDSWFVFDTALWILMVFETWVMYCIILASSGGESGGLSNASILRLFRILRLTRMARMVRLLRAMPELMILLKGIKVAMRSVFFTLCLLMLIIYVFAVGFTQAFEGSVAGETVFATVPDSVNALLLRGVLPDQEAIVEIAGDEHFAYKSCMLIYILLASLTVMNMLVGVLVEVVSVVSAVEKETLLVNYVKTQLQPMLSTEEGQTDYNTKIGKDDFVKLLENPEAARALQDVGVDVVSLVDFTDFIFKEVGKELSFSDCMDVVLQLRGTNSATVKDIVDLRKQVLAAVADLDKSAQERQDQMVEQLAQGFQSPQQKRSTKHRGTRHGNQHGPGTNVGTSSAQVHMMPAVESANNRYPSCLE
jgi:hypothetical protein